mgnify:FL=1
MTQEASADQLEAVEEVIIIIMYPLLDGTGSIGQSFRAEVGGAEVGDQCCGTLAILLGCQIKISWCAWRRFTFT